MGRAAKIWQWIADNERSLKIVFSIVAAVYIALQYYWSVQDAKIQRTLEYKKMFESGEVFRAKKSIDLFWLRPEQMEFLKKHRDKPGDDSILSKKAYDFARSEGHVEDIYVVHSFLLDFVTCVSVKQCDRLTGCQLFDSYMRNFVLLYYDFLDEWRGGWGAETIAPIIRFYRSCSRRR